ncbi:MAG TPA: hemolysin III family protein, partial [Ilumatobacteraceae bacterium]|nr:hemolysin III family protein [Ilumatobacteraceae bacterium]
DTTDVTVVAAREVAVFDAPLGSLSRPSWRGRLHVFALPVALVAMTALGVFVADGPRARTAVVIYAVGLCSMFAASATYHRWVHTLRARELWRRTDHAMIYAAIAGTFTPLCLQAVPDRWGLPLLAGVWMLVAASAMLKVVGSGWRHTRIVGGSLYGVISAVAGLAVPALWHRYGVVPALLVIGGGIFYVVGAVGFHRKWPTLRPGVFSYHEVWHAHTVVAAALHFAAVALIL